VNSEIIFSCTESDLSSIIDILPGSKDTLPQQEARQFLSIQHKPLDFF